MSTKEELPIVLVIGPPDEDWYQLCEDCKDKFRIEQAQFDEIGISSYDKYPIVNIFPPREIKYEFQKNRRTFTPSLIFIRSCIRYIGCRLGFNPDFRNVFYGFIHGNIPMINSFEACLFDLDRPVMFGILKGIQKRIGKENFPLIPQYYYSDSNEMVISPSTPFVVKYSYPHAGYGKIRVKDHHEFEDIKSIVAIDNHYCAAEPLIDSDYELRIAFIAPDYYRVHKRQSYSWKVNFGATNIREDVEMTPMYKMWIDEVRKSIPGMDCFCIDAIVDKQGKHYILEVNGSAQGFAPEHGTEYLGHMKKLVISRIDEIMTQRKEPQKEPLKESELAIENLNLKNEIEYLKSQLKEKDQQIEKLSNPKQSKKRK